MGGGKEGSAGGRGMLRSLQAGARVRGAGGGTRSARPPTPGWVSKFEVRGLLGRVGRLAAADCTAQQTGWQSYAAGEHATRLTGRRLETPLRPPRGYR